MLVDMILLIVIVCGFSFLIHTIVAEPNFFGYMNKKFFNNNTRKYVNECWKDSSTFSEVEIIAKTIENLRNSIAYASPYDIINPNDTRCECRIFVTKGRYIRVAIKEDFDRQNRRVINDKKMFKKNSIFSISAEEFFRLFYDAKKMRANKIEDDARIEELKAKAKL